ncbi:NADH:flavin oxidoreductase NADH oxidase [Grosmannia clavigera kw1407]|uniref:NADH:flavin oxidoreductase NADH oxidase n=1 Tax=Grosmannia clavigera (strain kw1407 / UAMH 11150) TaxID=655863 RepID=F0XBG6_GROCL|nr:NADH:flavin oxidoreductase NADH oxidase [Grosmannia clavigera kw1407]EFX04928.1 NADH:flavin oxidoreductase NADH oxidase [Grosmannia clavigera kw1407]
MSSANGALVPLSKSALFTPLAVGRLAVKHRIVQAPCTRMRCDVVDGVNVTGPRMVTYYGQRASDGGLQISEATDICTNASAYPRVPGVYAPAQLAGWHAVTDAVHAKGGLIVAQLWHTGRASGSVLRGGERGWSSGELPMAGNYLDGSSCADDPPRAMTVDEIHGLTAEWAAAAKRAVDQAGFDGIEIHGANGYLLEQFLHDNINKRTDAYGGSVENRCRFLLEVLAAVSAAIGADRVGIRLSPFNYFQDTHDSDPNAHWTYLCKALAALPADQRPAYVHMIEPRFDEVLSEQQKLEALAAYTSSDGKAAAAAEKNSLTPFRTILKAAGIPFLACGTVTRDTAASIVEGGDAELVGFGRQFISNPDLVKRLSEGLPLNAYDRSTFYGADPLEKGYNDYPEYKA